MKFATDELSVLTSEVLDVNPDLAENSVEIYFIESQLTAASRVALKPLIDRKVLRGMGKAIGMEKTDLLDRFLSFHRKMSGIDFIVSFDTWLTVEFCRKRELMLVTENKAVIKLCKMWDVQFLSPTSFGFDILRYKYERIKVRKGN